MAVFFVFLTALFVTMVLVAVLMKWAQQLHLVDMPDERKVHARVIPRIGGVGMVLGFATAVLIWMDVGDDVRGFLSGVLVISCFGLWDDRANLDYRLKFAGQLLAVLIVVFPGSVMIQRLSFGGGETLPELVSVPLTVLFLLGMTNAMNLSDGLDGLAAGLSMLSLVCIMALAVLAEDAGDLLLLAGAIIGATFGFLRYNTHPALVFMGDTGSQFLGFSLGVLAIWLTQQENTAVAAELPLLILGLPIIDTLNVMTCRMMKGLSPFRPDQNHFHHRLLDLGFDHYEAVLSIYAIQCLFVVSAYLLRYETGWVILSFYSALFASIVCFYPLAKRHGWRLRVRGAGHVSLVSKGIRNLRQQRWLQKVPYACVSYLIIGFLVFGSAVIDEIPTDVGYFALMMIAVSLVFVWLQLPMATWVQRLGIYTCSILVVYGVESSHVPLMGASEDWAKYFFVGLAVLIGLGMRYSARYYFSLTPSDFLVMGILLAVAYLPVFQQLNYAKLAVESAILLYGVEFVLRRQGAPAWLLWGGATLALAGAGLRAFQ